MAEAAALCSARRARSAPAAGGSRRRTRVEEREAGAGGEQGIALPCPSARPRPGRNRRRRRKGLRFRGFRRRPAFARALCRSGAATALAEVGEAGRRARVEIGANHLGMMNRRRRFVTLFGAESAPLVVVWGCPISLHYRT